MTELKDGPPREHLLLTVLGKNSTPAQYDLEGRQAEAPLAPVALIDLLPEEQRPERVLALCTPEAKQDSWPLLVKSLGDRCPVEAVEVPAGDRQEGIHGYLAAVTDAIPQKVELTLDVTHGYRHFSFLTYVGVLYLAALRGVRIRGAYYGLWKRKPEPSPFLDLRPLLELPRWIHALEVLRETGSALPMARILETGPPTQPARDNARDLTHLSEAYLSGLPLELGWQAWNVRERRRKPLRKLLRDDRHLPLADQLVERLTGILEPLALDKPSAGEGWKRQVGISEPELKRQACMVDGLLARESYATALRLMREWIVSWTIFRQPEDGWLEGDVRKKAEGLLHAIKAIGSDDKLRCVLTEEQRALGCFWRDLAEVRNAYAHHGMRGDDLVRGQKVAAIRRRVLNFWEQTLRCCPTMSLSLGKSPGGPVLVSPIGRRPGVLFSALQACRANGESRDPALCLVICSRQTDKLIAQALEHAGFEGDFEALDLEDAFGGGQDEIRQLVSSARRRFIGADEVLVNVTGGTTLMGLAAESLASEARSLACRSVRRFGLIDRRPPSEQENDPYQAGEPFWLDDEDDNAN